MTERSVLKRIIPIAAVTFFVLVFIVFLTYAVFRITNRTANNEFMRYMNNEYSSKFGYEDFECTGTCYCSSFENNRRSAMTKSVSSVRYAVASVSSFVAFKLAKEHFNSECENRLSDDCPSSSLILSEVEECVPKPQEEETTTTTTSVDWEKLKELTDNDLPANAVQKDFDSIEAEMKKIGSNYWTCTGHCYPNILLKAQDRITASQEFGCDKLRVEGQSRLLFDESETSQKYFYNVAQSIRSGKGLDLSNEEIFDKVKGKIEQVKRNFYFMVLNDFCESEGTQDLTLGKKKAPKVKLCSARQTRLAPVWETYVQENKGIDEINPSIKCWNNDNVIQDFDNDKEVLENWKKL